MQASEIQKIAVKFIMTSLTCQLPWRRFTKFLTDRHIREEVLRLGLTAAPMESHALFPVVIEIESVCELSMSTVFQVSFIKPVQTRF